MRKIAYVTGSRSEFGLMLPTLQQINQNKNLELQLIVTGTHLTNKLGIKILEKTKLPIFKKIRGSVNISHKGLNTSVFTGELLIELSKTFEEIKPDLILIEGDRYEQLATAIAGMHLNIPLIHISGGDISGSIDDRIRHALTKLSHIHFPGSKKSKQRIIKMGEEKWRIHMIGTPLFNKITKKEKLEKILKIDLSKEIILVLQHPVFSEIKKSKKQLEETLKSIENLNLKSIIIYPNGEPGSKEMIDLIEEYSSKDNFIAFQNLKPSTYLGLLKNCSAIVGNSSSGIVETPQFKTPCINIGNRQRGREQGNNVLNVKHNQKEITRAIQKAINKNFIKKLENLKNPYKSKNFEGKICKILEKIELNKKLIDKKNDY